MSDYGKWHNLTGLLSHEIVAAIKQQAQAARVSQLPAAKAFDAYIEQEQAKDIERRCPVCYCDWLSCPPKNLG